MNLSKTCVIFNFKSVIILINEQPLYTTLYTGVLQSLSVCEGLGGVVGLALPMARADRSSRPIYYLPCSDLGKGPNLHKCLCLLCLEGHVRAELGHTL